MLGKGGKMAAARMVPSERRIERRRRSARREVPFYLLSLNLSPLNKLNFVE